MTGSKLSSEHGGVDGASAPQQAGVEAPVPVQGRWGLVFASALHAAVFAGAARVLPWDDGTSFGLSAAAMAVAFSVLTLAALLRHRALGSVWRVVSGAALLFAVAWAYQCASAAAYLAALYGSLGQGLAAATAAAFSPVVLFTVPIALWGLSATRGPKSRRRVGAAGVGIAAVITIGLWRSQAEAAVQELPRIDEAPQTVVDQLQAALDAKVGDFGRLPATMPRARAFTLEPFACEQPLGPDAPATAVLTFLAQGGDKGGEPRRRCLQDEPEALIGRIAETIAAEARRAPIKIDWVVGTRRLSESHGLIAGLELRPGLDGVCLDGACVSSWQLVAADEFTRFTPLPFIQDLRIGFSPARVGQMLGLDEAASEGVRVGDLVALEELSLLVDGRGKVHYLPRGHQAQVEVDARSVWRAARLAEGYIVSSQLKDGLFRYKLDPFTGRTTGKSLNLPRQAGTTLVLCELGSVGPITRRSVGRSLRLMASRARKAGEEGELAFLTRKSSMKEAPLGSTALPLIAFSVCRGRIDGGHDELIGDLARGLLALQRPDGGFHPAWDYEANAPVLGPDPLFAEGQVVFALSELERIVAGTPGGIKGWPSAETLHAAVERAMDHYSGPYWDHALSQFFWVEENWHCLAARASLRHHRHDGYERMCLDYVRYKRRLQLDAASEVAPEFWGGYGFGNIIAPHNTGTAGLGEAYAAALTLAEARGERTEELEAGIGAAHEFLLRQQWTGPAAWAVVDAPRVAGGFSESMVSPTIRIDYAQHAMAALGHGARARGWAEPIDGPG